MSKAQVKASGWEECSACLSHGRNLEDCSEMGACRGPWRGGATIYDRMDRERKAKAKAPRASSSKKGGWYTQTHIAPPSPLQPYRGSGMIDRLENYTGTVYQPPQEGAPPGFYDDMPSYPENLIPQCDGYDPSKGHDWNLGNCNRNRDNDGDVPVTETCICIANTGRYGGPHCYEDFNGQLCGFENCICQNFIYTGAGCPAAYLGQPCETLPGQTNKLNREPWNPSPDIGHGCICIDYTWSGANCPPSMLGRSCGSSDFPKSGEYQRLNPDVHISRMSPLYPKAF